MDRNNSEGRGGAIPSLGEIRNCHINVGTGKELTIRQLSELVVKAVGFEGTVEFDAKKAHQRGQAPQPRMDTQSGNRGRSRETI